MALSSCSLHLALSPWAARTQAFPCVSQCLTWHSLQANGAGEDAVLRGVWEWDLGAQGPRIPSPAAIPLILAPGATLGGLCTARGTAGPLWSHCLEHIQPVDLSPPGKRVRRTWLDLWVGGREQPRPHPRLLPPFSPSCWLSRPHLRACSLRSCSEGLNTCRS